MTDKQIAGKVESLIKKMTLEEKCRLTYACEGHNGLCCGDIPQAGIPRLEMADGPQGLRFEDGRKATALPSGMALAATFDTAAAELYGDVIGREALAQGVQASLGPGFNLMRTPMCGRNFEYYGEDPVLAGKIASGYIRGCQERGICATPKHLAMNNQELDRFTYSANCSLRTLRELYLRPFEIVVKESRPWMMMSSYNRINGVYASACGLTQQKVIKDECGFDGVMVSDWGAVHDDLGPALNGLDLEMGVGVYYPYLADLVRDGYLPESVLDDKVRRILRLLCRTNCFDPENRKKGEVNTRRNRTDAKLLAQQGMTLLKNRDSLLPLKPKKLKKIMVVGPGANYCHSMNTGRRCGGSGAVHCEYEVTPLAGVRNLFKDCEIVFEPGLAFDRADEVIPAKLLTGKDGRKNGLTAEYRLFMTDSTRKPIENAPPFKVEHIGNLDLKIGKYAVPETERKSYLDRRQFMLKLSGSITLDSDGEHLLNFVSEGCAASLKVNGREVMNRLSWQLIPDKGYRIKGKKGDKFDIEAVLTRVGGLYMEFKLLWCEDYRDRIARAAAKAKDADAVLYFGGFTHSYDHESLGGGAPIYHDADLWTYTLPDHQNELIRGLCKVNKNVVVCNISGEPYDVTPWIDKVAAFIQAGYCGMESGNAWAEVLAGKAVPGGRLPYSWYRKLDDCACHRLGLYPGKRCELDGDPHSDYDEGVFIGYRYLEKNGIDPVFPFGYGLNYGSIEYRMLGVKKVNVDLERNIADFEVSVEAVNAGKFTDAAVAQVYVAELSPRVDCPVKELADFGKQYLKPGEKTVFKLKLEFRDFAYFDEKLDRFVVKPGKFDVLAGSSSADIFGSATVEL